MNVSVCTQRLGADVGLVVLIVHFHQSEAPFFDCFLTPECFDTEMLHFARSTPRHHAASCGCFCLYTQRNFATDFCEDLLQLGTACCLSSFCVPLCIATGDRDEALRRSTRFEHRLSQSDHDAETALRSVSFTAQSLSAFTSRHSSWKWPCEMRFVHKVRSCSSHCSTCCTGDSLMRFLTGYCISGPSVARFAHHTNNTAQPRFLIIVDLFVAVTLSGIFAGLATQFVPARSRH